MFGLIPRSVWSRTVKHDELGRIEVAHNCILLDRVGPPAQGQPRRVLIEVGSGDKLDAKMRAIFDLEKQPGTDRPRTVVDALAEQGVSPESIDAVVVSHLHFDHAGALTRLPKPGEAPDWPSPPNDDGGGGSSQSGGCVRTFPNAKVYTQSREWRDAIANRSVMTRTYFPDHLWPIESQLVKVDSPRPFPIGLTPGRDELPATPVDLRMTELFTTPSADRRAVQGMGRNEAGSGGVFVFNVPGHTWGQQAVLFREPDAPIGKGRTIVFTPDVMPTIHHNGAAYSLAYDVEPYTSMVTRRWFLGEAADRDWVLCLDHEPGHPLVRVRRNTKGWFDLIPEAI